MREDVMAGPDNWVDVGSAEELARTPLRSLKANNIDIALSFRDGTWGALSNACNHVGGPLGDGRLDQDYIICPWHGWKFQRCTGFGEPGFEADRVPAFPVRVEGGRVQVNIAAPTRRQKSPHPPHPLEREIKREPGPLRLAGISSTVMDTSNPRFSGSDHLLGEALKAAEKRGAQTRHIRLNDL
jgi:nitrite reductase/ring-hydroxylating ferredoxin subunit